MSEPVPKRGPHFPSTNNKRKGLSDHTHADTYRFNKKTKVETINTVKRHHPASAEEQLSSYALEMLSCTHGTRTHCILLLINGPWIEFWYFDASGIICSEPLDFIDDFERFAALILIMGFLNPSDWGIGNIPTFTPPEPEHPNINGPLSLPRSLKGYTTKMKHQGQDVLVTLGDEVFCQHGLVGRRTIVYDIDTFPKISNKELVLKMSMQVCGRTAEYDLLEGARQAGVGHLPEVHMHSEASSEWCLSHGVRGRVRKVQRRSEGECDVVGVGIEYDYEDRSQRLIVFTKYTPLEKVLTPNNMDKLFMELLDCLHDLRYLAFIVHCDISLTNLMVEFVEGEISLILNDFDNAIFVNADGSPASHIMPSSKYRVGTLPFMAYEILQDLQTPHVLRHDLEGAFYVALWCAVKMPFDDPAYETSERRDALLEWESGGLEGITFKKWEAMISPGFLREIKLSDTFDQYDHWLSCFHRVFLDGYRESSDHRCLGSRMKSEESLIEALEGDGVGDNGSTSGDYISALKERVRLKKAARDAFNQETFGGHCTVSNIKDSMRIARIELRILGVIPTVLPVVTQASRTLGA